VHVEKNGNFYSYVVTERGNEYERRATADPDELLYWLVSDAVFVAASEWELRNRRPLRDSRRAIFSKEIEWLSEFSPCWVARKQTEINEILQAHPFNDGLTPAKP
jgi:hypothetical protein